MCPVGQLRVTRSKLSRRLIDRLIRLATSKAVKGQGESQRIVKVSENEAYCEKMRKDPDCRFVAAGCWLLDVGCRFDGMR